MIGSIRDRLIAGVALAIIVAMPRAGWGQEIAFAPRWSASDAAAAVEALALSDEQAEAFRRRYDDLRAELHGKSGSLRRALARTEKARADYSQRHPGRDPWATEGEDFGYHDTFFAWRSLKREAEAAFTRDVAGLLEPEQQARWEAMVRETRRRDALPEVRQVAHVHATADLVPLVDALDLAEEERNAVGEAVIAYELEMDAAIADWERRADASRARMLALGARATRKGVEPGKELQSVLAEIERLAERVARLNVSHARAIGYRMSPEHRREFAASVMQANYPEVATTSPVDLTVDAILRASKGEEHEDTAARVSRVYADYLEARASLYERTVGAIDAWNAPKARRERERRAVEIIDRGGDPRSLKESHPVIPHLRELRELETATRERLRALLAEDERLALPEPARMLLSWRAD